MQDTSRIADGLTWREYVPSTLVTAPFEELTTITAAPGMATPLSSVTVPETLMVCARAKTGSIRATARDASVFLRLIRIVIKIKMLIKLVRFFAMSLLQKYHLYKRLHTMVVTIVINFVPRPLRVKKN